jgi:hypothetical protein
VASLFIILGVSPPVAAQEVSLSGTVTDSTDAVLPGATVTALHVDTGNTFVGVTDTSGAYRIGAMRTGIYRVTAELAGFTAVTRQGVELQVGQNLVMNMRLTLSSLQETITVTGDAPLVDTTQSRMATNIDPRQMQELPINGRDWLQLVVLSPGSRQTSASNSPVAGAQGTDPGIYQLNLDGQQVTQTMAQSGFGQPQFSRDAIAEFQYVSSRFDATQGRSSGVQVNAVSKSGTNQFSGSASAYFRDDRFNAKDFVANRVLPYSNQQYSFTFGGPITRDRLHFFGNYEGQREPNTIFFNSAFPRFNIEDQHTEDTQHIVGARVDWQASSSTRLMVRGSAWLKDEPISSGGGTSNHPSTMSSQYWRHYELFVPITTVIGSRATNEFKPGFIYHTSDSYNAVPDSPRISLRGYSLGGSSSNPLRLILHTYSVRDDFTTVLSRHEIKIGGEFLWQPSAYLWSTQQRGTLIATNGRIPANIEDLFPVWNDVSTWNLRPLSPNSVQWQQSFGNWSWGHNQPNAGAWFQDNWAVNPRLTLNLGIRWDLAYNWGAQDYELLPLRGYADNEWANFGPRLGFAYSLSDRTVIRGGWGKYFLGPKDQWAHHTPINLQLAIPSVPYDGRADFAVNPFNGQLPSWEEARAAIQDTVGWVASDTVRTPYSWQTSVGLQRQLGQTMSAQADYVWVGGRRNEQFFNTNLTYDPATGVNYPWQDVSKRRWPDRGVTNQVFSLRDSDYHALETMFSKRFSAGWQASVAYTLAGTWDCDPSPVFDAFPVAADLGGECGLDGGDYRHRLVTSGIMDLPLAFQMSGFFTYRSAVRSQETWGQDLRNRGSGYGLVQRLRPDGTIIPRNAFLGDDLKRVDLKLQRNFRLGGQRLFQASVEVFNLFNTASYSYVTNQASASYLRPSSGGDPRTLQFGLRYQF